MNAPGLRPLASDFRLISQLLVFSSLTWREIVRRQGADPDQTKPFLSERLPARLAAYTFWSLLLLLLMLLLGAVALAVAVAFAFAVAV